MKRCPKCGRNRRFSSYYQRKHGGRAGEHYEKCKDCMKSRGRNYYHQNKERQLPLAIMRRRKAYSLKKDFIGRLKDKPCADCGGRFPPYVMDFDHRDRHDKIRDVSRMVINNLSLNKIKSEVEKCDIVCANCHRIRTYSKRYAEIAKVVTAGL